MARQGKDATREYIEENILAVDTFEEYLERQGDLTRLRADEELGY